MQTNLELSSHLPESAYDYGTRSSGEVHGVVLTKPHVVALILDLAGYVTVRDLGALTLLEPSCGHGAFLVPAVERLLIAARREGREPASLGGCIRAFDIEVAHVAATRVALDAVLAKAGVVEETRRQLLEEWVRTGDFLLASMDRAIDVCVGNPPYIRIEQLSAALHSEYRARFRSLYDRADLYVAFIERGLSLLSKDGVLSFICADRWVLNKYGAPLREIVSSGFQVRCYIDLHHASPFESEVIAYPSIFVMSPGQSRDVPVIALEAGSPEECAAVTRALGRVSDGSADGRDVAVARYERWFQGDEPWIMSSPAQLAVLRSLEARFRPIGATARVGIGVATGSDKLYIVGQDADIEPDRLVPLVMRDDIEHGQLRNGGRYVINTFDESGRVVDLSRYPRLARYLERHGERIRKRHVAHKNPRAWFRTIDRVYPQLVGTPKLLIPDIAGSNEVAFDPGGYHPHHNLYFVTSDRWDLEVLGGLLASRVALFFVWSYALKMRGGYLRFQAQYLRRIRLPDPSSMAPSLSKSIKDAFRRRSFSDLDALALRAYELDELPDFDFVDTRK